MNTVTEAPDTAADQIKAAGTLMSLLTAHAHLRAPAVQLELQIVPGTYTFVWGLSISLHDGVDYFEQWRQALGLDPAGVELKQRGETSWLTVTGMHAGIPVSLSGFFTLDPGDDQ
ncbi:hypothetical protein ACFXDE_29370 [Kitasatospora sp. NPDC059408]|uniref:hypothetical protein n=1 Tax=Kitasatospora sp. NPDC059408 TaxID=3346823 RepID=UPI00369CF3C6